MEFANSSHGKFSSQIEDKVSSVSSMERATISHEREERRKTEIKKRYESLADKVKERQQAWVDKKLKEGVIERIERVRTQPEFFLVEKEEMKGRYGWFEASWRYNMPIYYSGIDFKNRRNYNQYHKYNEEISELNQKAVDEINDGIRFSVKPQYTEEEQAIVDEAKKNGTWMKAPNGKATNLTEKQWAQVRTKAFKKWFGDWEKALKNVKIVAANKHNFANFKEAK